MNNAPGLLDLTSYAPDELKKKVKALASQKAEGYVEMTNELLRGFEGIDLTEFALSIPQDLVDCLEELAGTFLNDEDMTQILMEGIALRALAAASEKFGLAENFEIDRFTSAVGATALANVSGTVLSLNRVFVNDLNGRNERLFKDYKRWAQIKDKMDKTMMNVLNAFESDLPGMDSMTYVASLQGVILEFNEYKRVVDGDVNPDIKDAFDRVIAMPFSDPMKLRRDLYTFENGSDRSPGAMKAAPIERSEPTEDEGVVFTDTDAELEQMIKDMLVELAGGDEDSTPRVGIVRLEGEAALRFAKSGILPDEMSQEIIKDFEEHQKKKSLH